MIGRGGGGGGDAAGEADLQAGSGRSVGGAAKDLAIGQRDDGEAAVEDPQGIQSLQAGGEEVGLRLRRGEVAGDQGVELGRRPIGAELVGL